MMTVAERLCLLLADAEDLARDERDGHLTIMRFTTGWKVMLDTPDLNGNGRAEVSALPSFESLEEALQSLWFSGQGRSKK
jgi:hypothetical protein